MLLSGSSVRPLTLRVGDAPHEVRDVVVHEAAPRFAITLDERGSIVLQNIDIVHRGRALVRLDKAERLAWAPGGELLVGTATDNVLVYDVETTRQTALYDNAHTWTPNHGLMSDLKTTAAGTVVVSASLDSTVTVWQDRRAVQRWRATSSTMPVYAVATHAHSVLSGGGDGVVRLWDLRQLPNQESVGNARCLNEPCRAVATYEVPERVDVTSLDFSVNGKGILIGGARGLVHVIKSASFGDGDVPTSVAFNAAHMPRHGTHRETLVRYLSRSSRYTTYTQGATLCFTDIRDPTQTCLPPRDPSHENFTALAVVHATRTVVTGDTNGNLGVWKITDN